MSMEINDNFGILDGISFGGNSRIHRWYHHDHLNNGKSKKYSIKQIEHRDNCMQNGLKLPGPHRAILVAQHNSVLHIEHLK